MFWAAYATVWSAQVPGNWSMSRTSVTRTLGYVACLSLGDGVGTEMLPRPSRCIIKARLFVFTRHYLNYHHGSLRFVVGTLSFAYAVVSDLCLDRLDEALGPPGHQGDEA